MEDDHRNYSYLHARDPSVDRRWRPRPERQVNLDAMYDLSDDESIDSTSISSNIKSIEKIDSVNVYLRLRPNCRHGYSSLYKIVDNDLIVTQPEDNDSTNKDCSEKHFTFSNIFVEDVPQCDIYNNCIRNFIDEETRFTVLTYGTSGSGKTFTLLGNTDNPGIVPRAIEQIFTQYADNLNNNPLVKIVNGVITILADNDVKEYTDQMKLTSEQREGNVKYNKIKNIIKNENNFEVKNIGKKSVFIWVSFVEIYNENVYDLLNSNFENDVLKRKKLKIITNDGNVFIKNLTSLFVRSSEEAYELLNIGVNRLSYAATNINRNSSRSHCIFMMEIIVFSPPNEFISITYKFCDLAGSEKLNKSEAIGHRLVEAQRINSSLLVLGRCLNAVYNNQHKKANEIVPLRDSKLTTLLQSSLLGKESITMIVNIQTNADFFGENLYTLNFASIAKKIIHKKVKSKMARYSLFNAHAPSTEHNEWQNKYELLLDELARVKSENGYLLNANKELENDMETQKARSVESIKSMALSQENLYNLWRDLETKLIKEHNNKIEGLNKEIQSLKETIEELEEALDEINQDNDNKKRKTIN